MLIPTEILSHAVSTLWCSLCLPLQLQVLLHLFREHVWRNMTNATTPLVNVTNFCAFSHLLNLSHIKLDYTLNHYIWTPHSINMTDLHPCRKIYYINLIANIIIKDKKIKEYTHVNNSKWTETIYTRLFNRKWTTYVILKMLVVILTCKINFNVYLNISKILQFQHVINIKIKYLTIFVLVLEIWCGFYI